MPVIIGKALLKDDPGGYLLELFDVYKFLYSRADIIFRPGRKGKSIHTGVDWVSALRHSISVLDSGKYFDRDTFYKKVTTLKGKIKEKNPKFKYIEYKYLHEMATMDINIDYFADQVGKCYSTLDLSFGFSLSKDLKMGLAEILAMNNGIASDKCARVADLYKELKQAGISFGKRGGLFSALAYASDCDVYIDTLANGITEAAEYLEKQENFSNWYMDKKYRYFFAAMLVGAANKPEITPKDIMLYTSILNYALPRMR